MRIASYNILSGGFSSYNYELEKPERIGLIKKAVKSLNADFIALIDTFRWDELYTNIEIASLFNYKTAYCINLEDKRLKVKGHNNGITVLTNLPVQKFETVRIETRNAIKTTLAVDGKNVDIFSVYLDDMSEDLRVNQINALVRHVNPKKPTIITGDLNTIDADDLPAVSPLLKRFADENPQIYKGIKIIIDDMKQGKTINLMQKYGFIDSDENQRPTFPSILFPAKIDKPILRIDYALHTKDILIKNFKVSTGSLFDRSSDHYPISFEAEIDK